MTYGYGDDLGGAYVDSMGNVIFTGLYDPWSQVYPSPGIANSPYAFPNGLDAIDIAYGNANPGGVGLVPQANDILGDGNFIGYIFPAYDTDYLLQASSQENIDYMLNGMGLGGYGTYADYNSLIQDSYYYYNQGVNTYEQFDLSNAYANDDAYYYGTMGYASEVAGWADSF